MQTVGLDNLLEAAKGFLIATLRGQVCDYEKHHPWRGNWEFVVNHSLQVEAYVEKILHKEEHQLSAEEVALVRVAAILHDIGRLEAREWHARRSAEIVQDWLSTNPSMLDGLDRERLLYLIATHSEKEVQDSDWCAAVLKDADILDEIGAMSIFMAANWIDRSSPFFFQELLARLEEKEVDYCNRQMERLQTVAGREILLEKKYFVYQFIAQLRSELRGTEGFYRDTHVPFRHSKKGDDI